VHQPKPAVVFVDDDRWESFFQLAAILRGAGIRTVRISVSPAIWRAENLLFDRNIFLLDAPSPEQLARILADEHVIDVQPTESLAVTAYAAVQMLPARQRSDLWTGRSEILDKWNIAKFVRELGLRSPETLLASLVSADEAVAKLTLPIVLKRRVGSSGSNVKVFGSIDTLREFLATLEAPSDWFYEQFIEGRSIVCAACASDDGIHVIATYEVLKRIHLRGPSSVAEFRHDPELAKSGRTLISALHMRGLVCFDIIRDSKGVDWIHDVNPRVFGGLSMCQLAGFDFRDAYLRCLGEDVNIEPSQLTFSRSTSYGFPEGRRDLLRSGSRRITWPKAIRWVYDNWKLLGSRYFFVFVIDRPTTSWRRVRDRTEQVDPSLQGNCAPTLPTRRLRGKTLT
jgi:hypothetical protein